jgi:hypothetical protein
MHARIFLGVVPTKPVILYNAAKQLAYKPCQYAKVRLHVGKHRCYVVALQSLKTDWV